MLHSGRLGMFGPRPASCRSFSELPSLYALLMLGGLTIGAVREIVCMRSIALLSFYRREFFIVIPPPGHFYDLPMTGSTFFQRLYGTASSVYLTFLMPFAGSRELCLRLKSTACLDTRIAHSINSPATSMHVLHV